MPAHELTTLDFLGRAVEARKMDDDLWFTAERVADMLGYADSRKAINLYNQHKDEFLPSETRILDSRIWKPGVASRAMGNRGRLRIFSLSGLDHLALLARTEAGVAARRWVIDLRKRFRSGESAEVPRADFEALKAEVVRLISLVAEKDRIASEKDRLLGVFAEASAVSITAAARVMGKVGGAIRQSPEVRALIEQAKRDRKAIEAAKKPLPIFDRTSGGNGNGNGATKAGL